MAHGELDKFCKKCKRMTAWEMTVGEGVTKYTCKGGCEESTYETMGNQTTTVSPQHGRDFRPLIGPK